MTWNELGPSSDVIAVLEFLRDESLARARELRGVGTRFGAQQLAEIAQRFVDRVNQREGLFGLPRITRILRHRAGFVLGLSPAGEYDLRTTTEWFDQVVENIEAELEIIDRKRVMWLTVCSAVLAAIAVLVGTATLAISAWALWNR